MRDTQKALTWIVGILSQHKIPFVISGWFAANAYGSTRPLADIDIEVHDVSVELISPLVQDYIIYGPCRYIDNEFDLLLMTLEYEWQEIDICGTDSQKLFDKQSGKWVDGRVDIEQYTQKQVYGLQVPIMKRETLTWYKKIIARDVDREDVEFLEKHD